MAAIGIDTHKRSLAACAVDAVGAVVDERTFDNERAGFVALAAWARTVAPGDPIGVEGSASYGAAAARHLVNDGLVVHEVPPHLSRRERDRSRRPGKSDPGDALAIAPVTLREPDLPPIRIEDETTELGLLLDRREDLVHAQTQARNRLHAHLVVLLPGYTRTAARLVRPAQLDAVDRLLAPLAGIRADLARELLVEVRRLGRRAVELEQLIKDLLTGHPLLELPGAGALTTARLVAEVGDIRRFRSPDAFAMLAGVAPIPASSGEVRRMRLNRGGNRQLNRALYTIALSQSLHYQPAKVYMAGKRADGKSRPEALRCLKRQLVRRVFRLLQEGQPARTLAA
jgi:transposase